MTYLRSFVLLLLPLMVLGSNLVHAADCSLLSRVPAPWIGSSSAPEVLSVEPRLRPRVEFWKRVWSDTPSAKRFIVDKRRPSVIHARVSCKRLFRTYKSRAKAEKACRERVKEARLKKRKSLYKARNKRGLLRRYRTAGRSLSERKRLARSAYKNLGVVRGKRESLRKAREKLPLLKELAGVFQSHGVPAELALLALTESALKSSAVSPMGAVGAYQFLDETGDLFLQIDPFVDERLDPARSAGGAARYLKRLKKDLGSWGLAVTAYNTGETRLRRRIRRAKSKRMDRVVCASSPGFAFVGQNHFAQVAALGELFSKEIKRVQPPPPAKALSASVAFTLADFAECSQTNSKTLMELNPSLLDATQSVPVGYLVRVP